MKILRALCLAQKEAGALLRGAEQRDLALPEPFAEEILRELMNTPFRLKVGGKDGCGQACARKEDSPAVPCLQRFARLDGRRHVPQRNSDPLLPSCSFALVGENVVAVEEQQRGVLRVLYQEQLGGQCSFDYPVREAARVMGELVPFLKLTGLVEISDELRRQLIQLPLVARVYLDRSANGRDVVARAQFRYGDRTIDPFDETPLPENLPRGEKNCSCATRRRNARYWMRWGGGGLHRQQRACI